MPSYPCITDLVRINSDIPVKRFPASPSVSRAIWLMIGATFCAIWLGVVSMIRSIIYSACEVLYPLSWRISFRARVAFWKFFCADAYCAVDTAPPRIVIGANEARVISCCSMVAKSLKASLSPIRALVELSYHSSKYSAANPFQPPCFISL